MLIRTAQNRTQALGVVTVAAASILLSACQTAAPSQYGAGDSSQDVCYAEHRELRESQNYFAEEMIKGAVTGAILGGLTGAILSGGSGRAIAAGAVTGAVAGGSLAYWDAQRRDARDRYALVASIHGDLVREIHEIDRVATTFAKVRACRTQHAASIKAAYKAGRITEADARRRLHALWLQYQSDIQVAESVSARMAERGGNYRAASDELVRMDGGTPTATAQADTSKTASKKTTTSKKTTAPKATTTTNVAAVPQTTEGVTELTSTNQVKQASFSQEVQQAKADEPMFDLSSPTAALSGPMLHAFVGDACVLSLRLG